MQLSPYFFGVLAILCIYGLSILVKKSWDPLALARGHSQGLSTSIFQNFIFTVLTVFAYVTILAARYMALKPGDPLPVLPSVPVNLMALMGLSYLMSASSKAIAVSDAPQTQSKEDKSNLVANPSGETDLTKVQMLIWTLISVIVYLFAFTQFISAQCFLDATFRASHGLAALPLQCPQDAALPDVDGALLVLMGVSQGGYVAGKLVSRARAAPYLEKVLPSQAKVGDPVSVLGNLFGDGKDGASIILKNATGVEYDVPVSSSDWADDKVRFAVPALAVGNYDLIVRANGQASNVQPFEIV